VEEITDEPLYRDRVCGIDIGKAGLVATIRVPSDSSPARRASETREFATTRRGVPDPEFRIIRLHTRYRRDLTEERTREKNRTEKLLESAAIKISSVVTDLHGTTGRDIMDQLIAGQRDPKVLAQLARTRARRKITELEHAPEGAEFFTAEHAALLKTMLARIDQLAAGIGELTTVIERLLAPYEEQLQQAGSMPGWGRRSAEDAVAETGVDMTKFPTGGHLASWAGRTPLDHQSGKRTGRARHKKGNKYLGAITGETAVSAGRTQTREGARYRKIARRRGKNKACVALGNTQLRVYHKLLSNPGMRYHDLGPDYYERQAAVRRKIACHVREIEALGLDVTLTRRPEPESDGTADLQTA
jgi:transposase